MKMEISFEDDSGLFIQRVISLLTKRQYLIERIQYEYVLKVISITVENKGGLPPKSLIEQMKSLHDVNSVEIYN